MQFISKFNLVCPQGPPFNVSPEREISGNKSAFVRTVVRVKRFDIMWSVPVLGHVEGNHKQC